jgi:hypothetical protein
VTTLGLALVALVDTQIGNGIGTVVADAFGDGSNVAINTSITGVSYAPPRMVGRDGRVYFETLGNVQGVGWGGRLDSLSGPGPSEEAFAHYTYDVPFVLRWPHDFDGTLVTYAHGYANLGLSLFAEAFLGEGNEARRYAELEGLYVSDAALDARRGHAVFAANLGGLKRDGSFSITGLEGPFTGQPLNASLDVPITRDLTLLAKRLVKRLAAQPVTRTIGTGHSGGALILQYVTSNVTTPLDGPRAGTRVFTGGNFVSAYDPASGVVFDGVIPIAGGSVLPHLAFPATARMILLAGSADYAGVSLVDYAGRLRRAGVDLARTVRVYQVGNLPHNFPEIVESTPNMNQFLADMIGQASYADGDRVAPVVAAAIDNLREWLAREVAPPPSRINGRALDLSGDGIADAIEFAQAGGATQWTPFVEDPAIDVFLGEQFELSAAAGFPGTVRRYAEVLAALQHEGSLQLPYTTCRLGGYEIGINARLLPFDEANQRWRNSGAYRACLNHAVERLAADGVYDKASARRVLDVK